MEFFGDDIDYPYRLLELNKFFTLDELKSQYKKMVLRYHPDKTVGNFSQTKEFRIITACYKYLLSVYKQFNFQDPQFNKEKKVNFNEIQRDYERGRRDFLPPTNIDPSKLQEVNRNFDVQRFNLEYEKHKYIDPLQAAGYSDFSLEESVNDVNRENNVGPEPLDGVDLADCYELGGKHNNLGRTKGVSKGLDFVDYKMAHTAHLMDESKINDMSGRKQYKSLDELKAERSSPIQLSSEDKFLMQKQLENDKKKELERIHLMNKQQKELDEYYQKTHSLLLR